MEGLRLDYFLMRGGLLVKGDKYTHPSGCVFTIENDTEVNAFNEKSSGDIRRIIKSFEPRKKSTIKIPDNFPFVAKFFSWKPDIDKLVEQQAQYDFDQIAQQLKGNEMSNYTQEMTSISSTAQSASVFDRFVDSTRKEIKKAYPVKHK